MLPIVKPLKPKHTLEPPSSHSSTSLVSPGSNRTESTGGYIQPKAKCLLPRKIKNFIDLKEMCM